MKQIRQKGGNLEKGFTGESFVLRKRIMNAIGYQKLLSMRKTSSFLENCQNFKIVDFSSVQEREKDDSKEKREFNELYCSSGVYF